MLLAIILAIGSGILDASSRIAIKASKFDPFLLLGIGFLSALPLYAVWLAYTGIPNIKEGFWIVVAFHVPLLLLAQWMTVKAHRVSQLTVAAPYLSLTTLFLFVTSPLMVGAIPTLWGFMGAVLIISGIVFVHTGEGFGALWRTFQSEPGVRYLIGVATIYAVTANLDKIALDASNAPFFLVVDASFLAIGAFALHVITKNHNKETRNHGKMNYHPAVIYGLVVAVSVIAHMIALGLTDQVPYVIAGKRAGTVLFATLSGLLLGLLSTTHKGEMHDAKRKIIASLVVIAGTLLVVLFG